MKKYVGHFIFILIIAVIATILFTWPFVTKISSYYTDYSDAPFNGWVLWYNHSTFFTGKIFDSLQYFQSKQFYPLPNSLAYSDHLFIPSLLFSPLFILFGNIITSVNVYVFLSFLLSFIAMYYTAYFFTKNSPAAIIGALVYTFNPLVFSHFIAGHYQLLGRYFLPLVFLSCFLHIRKPSYRHAVFFFLVYMLNGLTSIFFLLSSTTCLLIFIPTILILTYLDQKVKYKYIFSLIKTSTVSLPFLCILLYFSFPYFQFSNQEHAIRSLADNMLFVGKGIDWFTSTPNSWLYGVFVHAVDSRRILNPTYRGFFYWEHTLFLNITPILLYLLGINNLIKRTSMKIHRTNIIIFICFIMLLATSFILTTPKGFYYAYKILPWLKGIRTPSRFEFIVYVPFSLFIAYGVKQLNKFRYRYIIICLLFLAIFIENFQINNFSNTSTILAMNLEKQTLFRKLLHNKITIHIPVRWDDFGKASRYLNWDILTGETLFNGYSGYVPPDYNKLATELDNSFNQKAIEKIIALNIEYIIIHKDLMSKKQKKKFEQAYTLYSRGQIYEDDTILILDLKKFNFPIPLCNPSDNFHISEEKIPIGASSSIKTLVLVNNNNCYLPSFFMNRYRTITIVQNGEQKVLHAIFPILISPYEQTHILVN